MIMKVNAKTHTLTSQSDKHQKMNEWKAEHKPKTKKKFNKNNNNFRSEK